MTADIPDGDIEIVANRADVTETQARRALIKHENDLAAAIASLESNGGPRTSPTQNETPAAPESGEKGDTNIYTPDEGVAGSGDTKIYSPESNPSREDVSHCADCGADLSSYDDIDFCPSCGAAQPPAK